MSTNPEDDPVVFHRGPVVWDATSFDNTNRLVARDGVPISVDTILILDQFTGKVSQQSVGSGELAKIRVARFGLPRRAHFDKFSKSLIDSNPALQ